MKNNKLVKTGTGAVISFAVLKAFKNSADPYTRTAIGGLIGLGSMLTSAPVGFGIWMGSGLQLIEAFNGGRITKNEYPQTIFTLHESEGIKELAPGTLPAYNIDGFTFKGLNGICKIADGVHCQIESNGLFKFSGLGALVNKAKNGGYQDYFWCVKTGDKRWIELFQKSV